MYFLSHPHPLMPLFRFIMFAFFLHFQRIVKSKFLALKEKSCPFCSLFFPYISEIRPLVEKSWLRHCRVGQKKTVKQIG